MTVTYGHAPGLPTCRKPGQRAPSATPTPSHCRRGPWPSPRPLWDPSTPRTSTRLGNLGDSGHPPLQAGPGPVPDQPGRAGSRDRQRPPPQQAAHRQERPDRRAARRPRAARQPHPAQMRCDGDREALRLLMIDRDNAVHSCKTARTALAAVLVTAPAQVRERLRHLPRERRAKEFTALTCSAGADRQTRYCTRPSPASASASPAWRSPQPTSKPRSPPSSRTWPPPNPASAHSAQRRARSFGSGSDEGLAWPGLDPLSVPPGRFGGTAGRHEGRAPEGAARLARELTGMAVPHRCR